MVFPQSAAPMVVEIAPGAAAGADPGTWTWADVSNAWRTRGKIVIGEGRTDWGADVDPGSCALAFDNRAGNFAEHNPAGQWYGQLGRDTPLRVRWRRAVDTFTRTTATGWGTADSGLGWLNSGSASDFSVSGGSGRHSHPAVNQVKQTRLPVQLVDVEQMVDVSVPALVTGAACVTGVLARWRSINDYLWLRCEFDFGGTDVQLKITKVVAGVFTDLAVLDPVPGLAYAAGAPLRVRAAVDGDRYMIKAWSAAGAEPAGWQLQATDSSVTAAGGIGVQSWLVVGNGNTLPFGPLFDNYRADVDMFGGFVPAWVPRWDLTSRDRWVPVTAQGALYRLKPAGSSPATRSPLRRTIAASGVVAYWPAEDGLISGQVASALPGHPAMSVSGTVAFVATEDLNIVSLTSQRFGSSSLPDLAGGGQLSVALPAAATVATAAVWTVHAAARVPIASASGDVVLLELTTPGGTYVRWQVVWIKASSIERVIAYNAAGAATTILSTPSASISFGHPNLSVWQSGGTINVGWRWSVVASAYQYTGSVAGTLAGVATITVNSTGATVAGDELPVGHVAVWATQPLPYHYDGDLDAYGAAVQGPRLSYFNEAAHVRLARLAAEDRVAVRVPALDAADVTRMGWQLPGAPLALYQECAAADGGVLIERPFGLRLRSRAELYNQTPAMTLAASDLAEPPEPDPAAQAYRNRWVVSRSNGSSAQAQTPGVDTGTELAYEDQAELNLSTDDDLADQAGWRLWLTSASALRWPSLDLDLAARPALVDQLLCLRIGSRITITGPPADVAGQDIDVLVEGRTVTIEHNTVDVTLNCSPARPWTVAAVDGEPRLASDGSTLAASITSSSTSMQIASTTANGLWTTDASDFPQDFNVGGERLTVSSISGTTSPQTAAISARGVNGVAVAHAAGSTVDVWLPAVVPL